ncbi:ankyrin repeat-containing domain protein [Chlamydoabsidia padenii]|nr:ankyrin repeat-containing domain protein [Chlamydoabsidia padenii]
MTLTSLLSTPPISPTDRSPAMNWPCYAPPVLPDAKVQIIDIQVLQRYLERGGDCNVRHPGTKLSLLAWATKSSSLQGMRLLLDHALKTSHTVSDLIRFASGQGATAIHLATQQNFVKGLELINDYLQQGHNEWDRLDDKGWTALHYGVQSNACQAVDFILHHGAFGSPRDRMGVTPLTLALLLNHMDMVRRLIHTLDDHDFVALLQLKNNNIQNDIWVLLFDHHYNDDEVDDRDDWLYLTVFWNRDDVLALLLQYKQNHRGKFIVASQQLSEENSILYYTLQQGKLGMVKQLYQAGHLPPISPLGDNPCLLYAAAHGYLDVIPLLYTTTTSDACLLLTLQLAGPLRSQAVCALNSVLTIEKIMLLNPTHLAH